MFKVHVVILVFPLVRDKLFDLRDFSTSFFMIIFPFPILNICSWPCPSNKNQLFHICERIFCPVKENHFPHKTDFNAIAGFHLCNHDVHQMIINASQIEEKNEIFLYFSLIVLISIIWKKCSNSCWKWAETLDTWGPFLAGPCLEYFKYKILEQTYLINT